MANLSTLYDGQTTHDGRYGAVTNRVIYLLDASFITSEQTQISQHKNKYHKVMSSAKFNCIYLLSTINI